MKPKILIEKVFTYTSRILTSIVLTVPFFNSAQAAGSGLPNPLAPTGVSSLQQFVIQVAIALQQLGVPFLTFAFVSSGFVLVVLRGGKPEERKEWLLRLGWLGIAGMVMLGAPPLAQILYNTCKALGICP